MNKTVLIFSLFQLCFLCLFAQKSTHIDSNTKTNILVEKTDEEVIRENNDLIDSWFDTDDFLLIASTFTNDATILGEGLDIKGIDAIKKYWLKLEGTGDSWDMEIKYLDIRGDLAVQNGTFKLVYQQKGQEIISDVNYTMIWKKQTDSDWKIDTYQFTKR